MARPPLAQRTPCDPSAKSRRRAERRAAGCAGVRHYRVAPLAVEKAARSQLAGGLLCDMRHMARSCCCVALLALSALRAAASPGDWPSPPLYGVTPQFTATTPPPASPAGQTWESWHTRALRNA